MNPTTSATRNLAKHAALSRAHRPFGNAVLPKRSANLPGLEPYSGSFGEKEAAHLIRRTLFGARIEEIREMAQIGSLPEVLQQLTQSEPIAVPTYQEGALPGSFGLRMFEQKRSLDEKMTLFWHNHFAVQRKAMGVGDHKMLLHMHTLRSHAQGNVKALVKAVTLDPAMLAYLNGKSNKKGSPNENYGRELQELFTIGKGPEKKTGDYTFYTEDDVQQAARVLTGWSFDNKTLKTLFREKDHDPGDKTFSHAYGNRVIAGRTGPGAGEAELDDLLAMIFEQKQTALYLVRKLYRFFVHYSIDDQVEEKVIRPLGDLLVDSKYEIRPVLKALLGSAHFFHPEQYGALIKNPIDLVIGGVRSFAATIDDNPQIAMRGLEGVARNFEMELYNPPSVAGWPAYYQEPLFHQMWISFATLNPRFTAHQTLISKGERTFRATIDGKKKTALVSLDPFSWFLQLKNNQVALAVVQELAAWLFPVPLTHNQKEFLVEVLLDGAQAYAWGDEITKWKADPQNPELRKPLAKRLNQLLVTMSKMVEFQLS